MRRFSSVAENSVAPAIALTDHNTFDVTPCREAREAFSMAAAKVALRHTVAAAQRFLLKTLRVRPGSLREITKSS
jgi:hypothetical protein